MNHKKYLLLVFIITTITGCRSVTVNKVRMHTASTTPIAPGVVGVQENRLQSSDFQVTAIPEYKQPIRLGVTELDFNAATYKAYLKTSKTNSQQINFVDSLETKPKFIKLEVLDQLTVISELQKEHNTQTIGYLKNQKDAAIVSTISLAYQADLLNEIGSAEAVFLINDNYKQYSLSLVKNGKSYKTIALSDVTIFGYRLSYFCWGQNDKNRIVIFDIVDEADPCTKNTYRNASKAKEKIDYLKL